MGRGRGEGGNFWKVPEFPAPARALELSWNLHRARTESTKEPRLPPAPAWLPANRPDPDPHTAPPQTPAATGQVPLPETPTSLNVSAGECFWRGWEKARITIYRILEKFESISVIRTGLSHTQRRRPGIGSMKKQGKPESPLGYSVSRALRADAPHLGPQPSAPAPAVTKESLCKLGGGGSPGHEAPQGLWPPGLLPQPWQLSSVPTP